MPAVFFAFTVMLYVPAVLGVPVSNPPGENVRPVRVFHVAVHVILFPSALNWKLYASPAVASSSVSVVIFGGVTLSLSAIVSEYSFVSLPTEFSAVTTTVNVPLTLGTPVSFPDVLSVKPSGSPVAVHVNGDVPVASRVTL